MRISLTLLAVLMVAMAVLSANIARAQMSASLTATLAPMTAAPVATDTTPAQPNTAATPGKASGSATFTVDSTTHTLRWQVSYTGLSSDAVGAHIHTAAGPGVMPVTVLDLGRNGMSSPLVGSAILEDTQLADLLAGRDFIDVHTKLNQGGEIAGPIMP